MFNDKLKMLRKMQHFSQDRLAEEIGVSRQAVAKWESGDIFPDITNLIALSRLFDVSIDFLVKKSEACTKREGPLEEVAIDQDELRRFLYKAKIRTYASGIEQDIDGLREYSHDYLYEDPPYHYHDSYVGNEIFSGQEVVTFEGYPVWALSYQGRVLHSDFSSKFLKEALFHVTPERPFKGPVHFQKGASVYHCQIDGDLAWVIGREEVYFNEEKVYELVFHGGLLKE
ncbi:DUF5680 domain-containing protein [uncultured Enterococcus sp.]|uniref:DUF5680 domain-containing protein n=1 Tax=uncultured Enterococcus sp. TaxID=167972 RepID=UPI002AA8C59F|nr:DUF5680 domain-containing protein [uncultured Enterococcus sp.]